MKNKVIAISGYPGSGKSTVCNYIKNNTNYVYFDFGSLFRSITHYLYNELKLTKIEACKYINNGYLEKININYKIEDNEVVILINDKSYGFNELNNPKMNLDTVYIGGLIGDKLNKKLEIIIDDIKKYNNVLINARRPVVVYPNLDKHIFLRADFEKRLQRKQAMYQENYNVSFEKLKKRDITEEQNGFLDIYPFTKVIDTTNLSKDSMIDEVLAKINNNITFTYFNNLTLVLGDYKCNKNCPFCIAKNNLKFDTKDSLYKLESILYDLRDNDIKFNRFVLSGNGEVSLYDYEPLLRLKKLIDKYCDLFKHYRIHSSGNIFNCKDKFDLFNDYEIEVLRVALNSEIDKSILGYKDDYLKNDLFITSDNIKCDIALTDCLDIDNFSEKLYQFLLTNPSIKTIRFKKLLRGDNLSKQSEWVDNHTLDDNTIKNLINNLNLCKDNNSYIDSGNLIIFKPSGDYEKDLVINNGKIKDYKNNIYCAKSLRGL